MSTSEKDGPRVIGIIGFGFVLVAAVGVYGHTKGWWNPQMFIPWAMLAFIGFGLLGLNQPIMRFFRSLKSIDAFGFKLDAQERELADQKKGLGQLTAQVNALAMLQQNQSHQSVSLIQVPHVPPELLAKLIPPGQAQSAELVDPAGTNKPPQNFISTQSETKKSIYRPRYLDKGVNE